MNNALSGTSGMSQADTDIASGAKGLGSGAGGIAAALLTFNALRKHKDPWGEETKEAMEKQAIPVLAVLAALAAVGGAGWSAYDAYKDYSQAVADYGAGNTQAGNMSMLSGGANTAMIPLSFATLGGIKYLSKIPWAARGLAKIGPWASRMAPSAAALATKYPRIAKVLGGSALTSGVLGSIAANTYGKAMGDTYRNPVYTAAKDYTDYGVLPYNPSFNVTNSMPKR
jgi:hypothetical protein